MQEDTQHPTSCAWVALLTIIFPRFTYSTTIFLTPLSMCPTLSLSIPQLTDTWVYSMALKNSTAMNMDDFSISVDQDRVRVCMSPGMV